MNENHFNKPNFMNVLISYMICFAGTSYILSKKATGNLKGARMSYDGIFAVLVGIFFLAFSAVIMVAYILDYYRYYKKAEYIEPFSMLAFYWIVRYVLVIGMAYAFYHAYTGWALFQTSVLIVMVIITKNIIKTNDRVIGSKKR